MRVLHKNFISLFSLLKAPKLKCRVRSLSYFLKTARFDVQKRF